MRRIGKIGLVILVVGIMTLGYGGLCSKKSSDSDTTSGSSAPAPFDLGLMKGATPPPDTVPVTQTVSAYTTTDGQTGTLDIIQGQAIIYFNPSTSSEQEELTLASYNAEILSKIPVLHSYLISYTGEANAFLSNIRTDSNIELAEADIPVTTSSPLIPNEIDSYPTDSAWYLDMIDAYEAWDITQGSSSNELCIIDGGFAGITLSTSDFAGRIVDNDIPSGTSTHGANVAGFATAKGNYGGGMAGIDWNCRICLKSVKVGGVMGTAWRVKNAIAEAVNQGAKVINISLGAEPSTLQVTWRICNWVVLGGIKRINTEYLKKMPSLKYLVVFAAGNDDVTIPDYANYPPNVIYVAGVGEDGRSWNLGGMGNPGRTTNNGPYIDIAAPAGGNSSMTYDLGYYSYQYSNYFQGWGTSYAAPLVAGACSLIWSVNPDLTAPQVKSIIKDTATDIVDNPGNIGAGILNIRQALGASTPAQVTLPNPTNGATDVSITTQLTWASTSGATSYDVYFGTSSPGTFRGNQAGTTYNPGTLANSTPYYWRIDSKNTAGTTTGNVWSFTTVAESGSITFNYTGGQQTWVVPAGVTSIQVDARGAKGGTSSGAGVGGNGARVQMTLSVTPDQTLYIYVGGAGTSPGGGGGGGYNGGGNGGVNGDPGGGGGASDIRQGGTALGNRVVVAGGGGGGGCTQSGSGGAGGYNGGDGGEVGFGYGGGGGTQSAGGINVFSASYNGSYGGGGYGGNGGGGGGGGYYGGAGGMNTGGSGGGGSSYSAGSGTTYTSGYQSGNGQIIITY